MLSVEIQAEAVQAANVMPDFTAEAPWGEELEIEQCVHEADNTVSEVFAAELPHRFVRRSSAESDLGTRQFLFGTFQC